MKFDMPIRLMTHKTRREYVSRFVGAKIKIVSRDHVTMRKIDIGVGVVSGADLTFAIVSCGLSQWEFAWDTIKRAVDSGAPIIV